VDTDLPLVVSHFGTFSMTPPPSPTVPGLLLVMVILMLILSSMLAADPDYWVTTIQQVQTHFVLGAFLIPICLLLAVQVFGLPQVNPVEQKIPTAKGYMAQTTSIILAVVIFTLLMFIPLRGSLVGF
jgi:hypothetical protein